MKVYAEVQFGGWVEVLKAAPLRASGGNMGGGTENIVVEDMVYPLEGNGSRESHHGSGYNESNNKFKAFCKHTNCLYSAYGTKWNGNSAAYNGSLFVKQVVSGKVRRLTPLECERLQGLPDGWTLINDKSCSDSARYKAIGNGMAQPVADWIIKRIVEETDRD